MTNDLEYARWKGWGHEIPFGHLSKGDIDYFDREMKQALRDSGRISHVLEVGFGNGAFLAYGRGRGWTMVGTELSPAMVEAARRSGFDAHDAAELARIPAGSMDLIAAFDVLEHVPDDDAVAFLAELGSKLKPGGRLFLRFPNADSWLGNVYQSADPTHVSAVGYHKLVFNAERAGLKVHRFAGEQRRGFADGTFKGLHSLIAGPIASLWALIMKALYFPGSPIVLSTSNVTAVLVHRT